MENIVITKENSINQNITMKFLLVNIIKLLRPKQWVKNTLIFGALFFSGKFLSLEYFSKAFLGFTLFCCLSSSIYIINDIFDRKSDMKHPKKCNRPIASGIISIPLASSLFITIFIVAMYGAFYLNLLFFVVCVFYFILMFIYSLYLKRKPIFDVMIISTGFVLRAFAGMVVIDLEIGFSPWLIMCTILLSLFIALHKRKSEITALNNDPSGESRIVLKEYTPEMLQAMIGMVDSSTIIAYCLYTISAGKTHMMFTIPFVIYGLFRYQYLSSRVGEVESPEVVLLTDKPLLVDVLLWVITCTILIYYI